ncbi:MAG: clostripain-related cysteine peptidase [Defluviitaleaceae bacterium]|nr:clostripain-related cysteine peptidase [Defluviitaleaceae bacterium]
MSKIRWILLVFVMLVTFAGGRPAAQKPYTIMVYMNGSDLESEFGAATADLVEMLDSGLDSRVANVLILTGGAKRWMNEAIPEYECLIWELADGQLNEIENMGLVNMGNPDTLAKFISFCQSRYPAEKYGLIMWDHGGGSIAGFGHDEKFDDASLTLLDMAAAFEAAGLRENKLEFLGFDACLMATVEMAIIAADYANVLIASEDLEPGDGWDYVFLGALNHNPSMDGHQLGRVIVDTFMDFYGEDSDEILTLSVVELSKVQAVMEAMGALMARASTRLEVMHNGFVDLSARRSKTKTFGEGSPRDNYADMVDIGDMAIQLQQIFPAEVTAVLTALESCVSYNRHNSDTALWGLSTFYIYGGKSLGVPSLAAYSGLGMDENFTEYLHVFFEFLTGRRSGHGGITRSELALWQPTGGNSYRLAGLLQTSPHWQPIGDLLWPTLGGHNIALYPIAKTANARMYAIPAVVNGRDADIIVSFTGCHPAGQIKGIRYQTGGVIQKGHDPIDPGDEIALYFLERNFATGREEWAEGEVFAAALPLELDWQLAPVGSKMGSRGRDVCCDDVYVVG